MCTASLGSRIDSYRLICGTQSREPVREGNVSHLCMLIICVAAHCVCLLHISTRYLAPGSMLTPLIRTQAQGNGDCGTGLGSSGAGGGMASKWPEWALGGMPRMPCVYNVLESVADATCLGGVPT